MNTDEATVRRYIDGYTGDPSAICFAWNGKHEEPFEDANELFRDAVINCVIDDPAPAPLPLLVDLYRALTCYSVEAWCIDKRVETIGRLMLVKGRGSVASVYIEGARQSFDSLCATSFVGCPRDVAEECLELACANRKSAAKEEERDFWETAVERFELLLKHAA